MRISKRSHVFVPSPHGDLRVVIFSVFVGMRTGPLTLMLSFLARAIRSDVTAHRGTSTQCLSFYHLSRRWSAIDRRTLESATAAILKQRPAHSSTQRQWDSPFSSGATSWQVKVMRMRELVPPSS